MKIPCRREWLPTPVYLHGEFHGLRSLADCRPTLGVTRSWTQLNNGYLSGFLLLGTQIILPGTSLFQASVSEGTQKGREHRMTLIFYFYHFCFNVLYQVNVSLCEWVSICVCVHAYTSCYLNNSWDIAEKDSLGLVLWTIRPWCILENSHKTKWTDEKPAF